MKLIKLLILAVFFTSTVNAQLSDFDLQLTKQDESCPGNGSLTFVATNLTPGSSVIYSVYLLPDITNPIAVLTGNTLGSLSAGTYRVVASQTLGDGINTETREITINNVVIPFNFAVTSQNTGCSGGGTVIVNATSGTLAQVEIISGPVTRPIQTDNEFHDMPAGTYNIRAYDICGVGKVKSFTLVLVDNTPSLSAGFFPSVTINSCTSITVANTITVAAGSIVYPLTIQYLIHVPGQPDQVVTDTYNSGAPTTIDISADFPFIAGITYEVTITDGCGDSVTSATNSLDPELDLALSPGDAPCAENYLILNASNFMDSFTVNFLQAPAGFNPAVFNPTPNGPFTTGSVNYGDEDNPVPFGLYEVEITDECGRTQTATLDLQFIPLVPSRSGTNNGCFSLFGRIRVNVPEQILVSAIVISGPPEYGPALPHNVTTLINAQGTLQMLDVPIGNYVIRIIDDCGFTYDVPVEVPPFVQQPFTGGSVSGCEPGIGGVRVASGNGVLTSINIVNAPAAYQGATDVTEHITPGGILYLADLPAGQYVFEGVDACGILEQVIVDVAGYIPTPIADRFDFTPGCGVFSVMVTDTSNGILGAEFWLQRFDPVTQTWGHPATGVPYPAGTVPNTTNSLSLANNVIRPNLEFTGLFRIVKKHESMVTGEAITVPCIDEEYSGEFEFTDTLTIDAAYTLACAGQPNDVLLAITGYPTSIQIIRMNGLPFFIDNGTNPLFTNLAPAEYTFLVSNECNIFPQSFNVQSLPSIATANDPGPMLACVEAGTAGPYEFDLFTQNPEILDTQPSGLYTITYHTTQAEADAGTNPLPQLFSGMGGETIYARVIHNEIDICYETTSFQLMVGQIPHAQITTTGIICDDGVLQLTAQGGFENYRWSNGQTTRTIYVTEPGIYTVTVDRMYGDLPCTGDSSIEVLPSGVPTIDNIVTTDWTVSDNTITVYVSGAGVYEYSLDGAVFQESNIFTGLETGVYTIFVRDVSGCGGVSREVVLLNYPKFFTPNADGINDRWRIPFSLKEPDMNVAIYDRYGKLLITFGSNYEGWDGTLNGRPLPSTDYWFVVTRQDGRELRGHFSMLR